MCHFCVTSAAPEAFSRSPVPQQHARPESALHPKLEAQCLLHEIGHTARSPRLRQLFEQPGVLRADSLQRDAPRRLGVTPVVRTALPSEQLAGRRRPSLAPRPKVRQMIGVVFDPSKPLWKQQSGSALMVNYLAREPDVEPFEGSDGLDFPAIFDCRIRCAGTGQAPFPAAGALKQELMLGGGLGTADVALTCRGPKFGDPANSRWVVQPAVD